MRRRLGLIWLAATAVVSAVVGVIAYQAGWAAGVAARLPEGAVAPYYYGPHFFGFFGFLPFLFLLLVLLFVFRAGRRFGPWGGWGYRGYGRYAGAPPQPGQVPPAEDPMREWPRRPPAEQPAPPERK
jgi:hypothetical protein